ncbi:MAG: HI0074 family nucleotidyltransferase substrate-binding subunit [Bacteroidota bacterium]
MMELLKKKHEDATRAWKTLRDILSAEQTVANRDAAIQRFEYTTEAVWKCLQSYLKEEEGIECYSPKSCLREAKSVGLLDDQETVLALQMIDDRNMTSHTYHEKVAEKIFGMLPQYAKVMEKLLQEMKP